MAISKTRGAFSAWAAVAMGGVSKGAEIDVTSHYLTRLHIQAFLDVAAATAHTGTEVRIQTNALLFTDPSPVTDEGWNDCFPSWDILTGTCNPEPQLHLTDPAPIGTVLFPVTSTTGYVVADVPMPWIALQDPTLANSELLQLIAISATPNMTMLDGTTRTHAKTTSIFGNIAYSNSVTLITKTLTRLRIVMNNNKDSNGAIINWRFAWTANLT